MTILSCTNNSITKSMSLYQAPDPHLRSYQLKACLWWANRRIRLRVRKVSSMSRTTSAQMKMRQLLRHGSRCHSPRANPSNSYPLSAARMTSSQLWSTSMALKNSFLTFTSRCSTRESSLSLMQATQMSCATWNLWNAVSVMRVSTNAMSCCETSKTRIALTSRSPHKSRTAKSSKIQQACSL